MSRIRFLLSELNPTGSQIVTDRNRVVLKIIVWAVAFATAKSGRAAWIADERLEQLETVLHDGS